MLDAEVDQIIGRTKPDPAGEGEIQVPGDEIELVVGGIEVEEIVVADAEDAVEVGGDGVDGQMTEELIDVEIGFDAILEGLVVGVFKELDELDHAPGLPGRCLPARLILRDVIFPVIAQVA